MTLTSKTMLSFAVVGYLVAIGLFFAPVTWHIPARVVYSICPAAFATLTVDRSFIAVAVVLAPFNALFYGVLGVIIGFMVESVSKWKG